MPPSLSFIIFHFSFSEALLRASDGGGFLFRIEINHSLQGSTANGAENGVLVCAHAAVV
jgi:hypothetical protein